jgi:hypothetical protein
VANTTVLQRSEIMHQFFILCKLVQ